MDWSRYSNPRRTRELRRIPGLPAAWRTLSAKEAEWSPHPGYLYRIELYQGRWLIHFFPLDSSTGETLRVMNIPASISRTKLGPEARHDESTAKFVHGFDAADAATAHWAEQGERIRRIYERA